MIPVLVYPQFDPIMLRFGPIAIHWYAMAYITGLVLGWRLLRRLVREAPAVATPLQVDDFLSWATLGVVIGGRLGYVLFYQPGLYFHHPLWALEVWQGGMSFHGGLLGVAVAIAWYCRGQGIDMFRFADRLAVTVPIGLGLGRVANFINGELWGRPAPAWLPIAMIYPQSGSDVPRYPSELIEMTLEGIVLFAVLYTLSRRPSWRERSGLLTGCFLLGYGIARTTGEFFRQPDPFLGYLVGGLTMGQILSFPMILAGAWLIRVAWRRAPAAAAG